MLTRHALRPLAAAMLLFLTSMPLPSHAADTTRVVTARQFGAIPDDGRDDTKTLRAAAELVEYGAEKLDAEKLRAVAERMLASELSDRGFAFQGVTG